MAPNGGKMIDKEKIEAIKRGVDLMALVQSRGVALRQTGKGWFGLCPFHDDKNPSLSVSPDKNLWQCFGCGKGGDVIRFVELYDRVDFKEAVRRLSGEESEGSGPAAPGKKPPSAPEPPAAQQCLERAAAVYETNFARKDQAKAYLQGRGITDAGLFAAHAAGLCDGALHGLLPRSGGIRQTLKRIGILLEDGSERFNNCVVFPVHDLDGRMVTLYGRRLDEASGKKHLFLPGRPTGLWNGHCIKTCSEIILTESVIDALSVQMAGFANVASIQGVNGLCDREIMDFKIYRVQRVILLMDGDAAGIEACGRLKEKLHEFSVDIRTLPDGHDPNSFLTAYGPDRLAEFIQAGGREQAAERPQKPPEPRQGAGFVVSCGIRRYRVMSLDRGPNRLKAAVRLEHAGKLHIDSFDLYTARARSKFAADLCRKFELMPETVEADITRIIQECENRADEPKAAEQKPAAPAVTGAQKKEAEAFGRSKDLIRIILDDFQTCGLIGEEANKLLGYIAMTSRKRNEPLSVLILSSSGSGKSALQDAVVGFCPPEDLVKLTSLSGKALFYKDRTSLRHKVLALEEGDGAEDAAYAIRSLISAGVLINETTIKDLSTGRLTTMENRVEGPTAVFYTTTSPEVDPETRSRFFVVGIDESREQTRRILAFQREKHREDEISRGLKAQAVIGKHHAFQRLLKPVGVKNPYSVRLTYGDDRLQSRRDQPKYLNLIKSVAFLRQMQKPAASNGQIEVDPEDIRIANKLAREILGRSLDELSRPGRDLLMLLDEMIETRWQKTAAADRTAKPGRTGIAFTRRDIREHTGWSNTRVHRYLKELTELEYVLTDAGRNGSRYRYRLAYEGQGKDGSRFILGLTSAQALESG